MEITKMILEFIAENPWKTYFILLAFRPFKMISWEYTRNKKDN